MWENIMIRKAILFALLAISSPSIAQKSQAVSPPRTTPSQPQVPAAEAMIILIRATVVALSQANLTNNYSVMSGLGSPSFRTVNTPQRLQAAFASFRDNRIDMNPVVYVTPQLTAQPIVSDGKLRLIGFFPSQPMRVNFDLSFEPSDGVWKVAGMSVNLANAQIAQASTGSR
jgi:hypothetical protein